MLKKLIQEQEIIDLLKIHYGIDIQTAQLISSAKSYCLKKKGKG